MPFILFDLIILILIKIINPAQVNHEYVHCPDPYTIIPKTKVCIWITHDVGPHSSNRCLSLGSTSTHHYLELILKRNDKIFDYIQGKNTTKFWLPIEKNEHDFLVWKLPIPLWNQKIKEISALTAPQAYKSGRCALYDAVLKDTFMENCRNEYSHICFYDSSEIAVVNTELCRNKLIGRASKFHKTCFQIEQMKLNKTVERSTTGLLADKFINEKLIVVKEIISSLGKSNESILFASNKYVTVFENSIIKNEVSFRIVEYKIENTATDSKPSIDIVYDIKTDALTIQVKHYPNLWSPQNQWPFTCHYDLNILENTIYDFKVNEINALEASKIYKVNLPYQMGIATFWCEAQAMSTFDTYTSNRLVIERNLLPTIIVMCIYIETSDCATCNFYGKLDRIRKQTNHFTEEITSIDEFVTHEVQLKKILPTIGNTTKYLLHVLIELPEQGYVTTMVQNELDNIEPDGYYVSEVRVNNVCYSNHTRYFPNVKLNGKSVFRNRTCFLETGLPPVQECVGNLIDGAQWKFEYDINELLLDNDKQCKTNLVNERSEKLFKLNEMLRNLAQQSISINESRKIVEETIAFVNETVSMLHTNVTDLRYATVTLHNLLESVNFDVFNEPLSPENSTTLNETITHQTLLNPITDVIDTIMDQQTDSLIGNDNNKLVETIDLIAERLAAHNTSKNHIISSSNSTNHTINDPLDYDDGVTIIHKNNFILMIVNPLIANITGIALYKIDEKIEEKSFHDFSVKKLRSNETLASIYNESLEITAHIPHESFDQIKIKRNGELVPPNRIIFSIYYKNSLFNENITAMNTNGTTEIIESESKVIGMTIPNYHENKLPPGIFTMFKTKQTLFGKKSSKTNRGCSDNTKKSFKSSGWDRDLWQHREISDSIVLCPVKRLANIGFVKLFGNIIVDDESSDFMIFILHYITICGCAISLFGLVIIFVTSFICDAWRSREATPLILNVSTATFMQLIMFIVADSQIFNNKMQCLMVGGVLHYVTLAGFFISLFVTNCQYRRYIIVFGSAKTKFFKIKIFLLGWILPLAIVMSCVIFTPNSYIPNDELYELGDICYPSKIILYIFVHMPIILIFCINVCVYIWIIIRLTQENPGLRKTPKKSRVLIQIRLFFFIFFMLSLTWAFGLLAHYTGLFIFTFLFNVTGPLQGFCLFAFCVVMDHKTRTFWIKFMFGIK